MHFHITNPTLSHKFHPLTLYLVFNRQHKYENSNEYQVKSESKQPDDAFIKSTGGAYYHKDNSSMPSKWSDPGNITRQQPQGDHYPDRIKFPDCTN